MSPDQLKARARRIAEEVLTQGDLGVTAELIAADCAHAAPQAMAPGPAGLNAWVRGVRRAFPDLRAVVDDEIAEGDAVVMRLSLSGTHEGPFAGRPATGRVVAWSQTELFRAGSDGTFAEHWSLWDRLGLLRQIDGVPDEEARP